MPELPEVETTMRALATQKFGAQYRAELGVVRPVYATPLKPELAELRPKDLGDPHVAFFLRANRGYVRGDELVCLTELNRANLTPAGLRMLSPKLRPAKESAWPHANASCERSGEKVMEGPE